MSTPKKAKDTVVQPKQNHSVIESQNHRMAWVERDLKDHPGATPLPRAGSPSPRPGCPEPHAAWKPMFKLQCTYKKHYRSHSLLRWQQRNPSLPDSSAFCRAKADQHTKRDQVKKLRHIFVASQMNALSSTHHHLYADFCLTPVISCRCRPL